MKPVLSVKYDRECRTAIGHIQTVEYIATITAQTTKQETTPVSCSLYAPQGMGASAIPQKFDSGPQYSPAFGFGDMHTTPTRTGLTSFRYLHTPALYDILFYGFTQIKGLEQLYQYLICDGKLFRRKPFKLVCQPLNIIAAIGLIQDDTRGDFQYITNS